MSEPAIDHIMQVGLGFWASKVLLSAVEMELFDSNKIRFVECFINNSIRSFTQLILQIHIFVGEMVDVVHC